MASDNPVANVAGILFTVSGLVVLRVRHWIRKERVLRQVGVDLHVPPEE